MTRLSESIVLAVEQRVEWELDKLGGLGIFVEVGGEFDDLVGHVIDIELFVQGAHWLTFPVDGGPPRDKHGNTIAGARFSMTWPSHQEGDQIIVDVHDVVTLRVTAIQAIRLTFVDARPL